MVSNSSVAVQRQSELERIMVSVFTGVPCVVLLTINAIILFTLRSRQVFRETSRYVLLTNLLVADSLYLLVSQVLYIFANSRVLLSYPVCGTLILYAMLTESIFPLTLAEMSIERYVAVCFPLRHSSIVTMRSTAAAIAVVWAFSCVNVLICVVLMCQFPFEELDSLEMNANCNRFVALLTPVAAEYDRVYNIFVFSFSGLIIMFSFIAVMITARSTSTDRNSARKARSTVLLHMIQLGLGLSPRISLPVSVVLFQVMSWINYVRLMNVTYVLIMLLPRGLSPLIYGLRDQAIRPILLSNLCCGLTLSVKNQISS
ncbi:odorant receptor 131-2-like [Synchiropus splendidus]|uniref:odorant receptor 131-2-like n=1 Tax=Synchiropus splendidus TaxID=270530 RepID=UPI00237EB263|nr:odorant receptor 131-2-like [Synchiropus splendidus]XP_053702442.1 odorant receptor 131-2-like [Synchiropus splendidus]